MTPWPLGKVAQRLCVLTGVRQTRYTYDGRMRMQLVLLAQLPLNL
jgi:hypothetical protein